MPLRRLTLFFILAFLIVACQPKEPAQSPGETPEQASAQQAPGGSSGAPAKYQYIFETPADPVQVSPTLETDAGAEALIPLEGGALSVTGADGTTYTLEIPSDALTEATTVRMTPLSALGGIPFGSGQTYAVQLEPQGLFFNNFATLTITPAQAIPVDEQLTYSYEGQGEDLVLAPPVVDSSEIKIQILHFSGYGVTKGLLADIEPERERLGGSAERRLQNLTAEILLAERQRQLLGIENADNTSLAEALAGVFQQYEEQVLKPRLEAAGESCAAGRLALQTALGYERQKQLLGISDESSGGMGQFSGLMDTVADVCLQEEYELCAEEHVIHRMIPVWLGIERQYQLLGVSGEGAIPAVIQKARDLTQKCLTFELDLESTGVFDDGEDGGYESTVESAVKLRFIPDEMLIKGEAPLVNTAFDFRVKGCSTTSNRGGSTFEVLDLTYISSTSAENPLGEIEDFRMGYYPAPTTESYTVSCPDSGSFSSPQQPLWSGIFWVLHEGEIDYGSGAAGSGGDSGSTSAPVPGNVSSMMELLGAGMSLPGAGLPQVSGGAVFLAQDWEIFGDEYFAKKEWILEDAGLGIVETGTFKLYHRPGG